ncbi:MAG: hypothetical protein U0736_15760 [Gemmataceae bacterium]
MQEPHRRLVVQVDHLVEVTPRPATDPAHTPPWEAVRDGVPTDRTAAGLDAFQFVFGSRFAEPTAELTKYAHVVHLRPAGTGGGGRPDAADPPRLPVRPARDDGVDAAARGVRPPSRGARILLIYRSPVSAGWGCRRAM